MHLLQVLGGAQSIILEHKNIIRTHNIGGVLFRVNVAHKYIRTCMCSIQILKGGRWEGNSREGEKIPPLAICRKP